MFTNAMEAVSTYAEDIDHVVWLIGVIVGGWFFLAQAVFFGLLFKFRAREGVRAQYISGEEKSQMRWIQWPHYTVLIFDVIILVAAVKVWVNVKQDMPPADETVRIISQQWAWTFVHPGPNGKLENPGEPGSDDISVVDELHVELGKTVHFELLSRDVLHSFSVPAFRLKQDAIPGREIKGWFKTIKTGTFDIQCAEICGIGHGIMGAQVMVESPADHAKWLKKFSPVVAAAPAAGEAAPEGTK